MPAYVIGHITVTDQQAWTDYRAAVPASLEPWGGELLFRGQFERLLGGNHRRQQTVAIRFADLTAANNWFDSDDYQRLIPLRERAAKVDLLMFDGI